MPGWKPSDSTAARRRPGGPNAAYDDRNPDGDQREDQEEDKNLHTLTRPNDHIQVQNEAVGSELSIPSSFAEAVSLPSRQGSGPSHPPLNRESLAYTGIKPRFSNE